jgi:hypothetical protein
VLCPETRAEQWVVTCYNSTCPLFRAFGRSTAPQDEKARTVFGVWASKLIFNAEAVDFDSRVQETVVQASQEADSIVFGRLRDLDSNWLLSDCVGSLTFEIIRRCTLSRSMHASVERIRLEFLANREPGILTTSRRMIHDSLLKHGQTVVTVFSGTLPPDLLQRDRAVTAPRFTGDIEGPVVILVAFVEARQSRTMHAFDSSTIPRVHLSPVPPSLSFHQSFLFNASYRRN